MPEFIIEIGGRIERRIIEGDEVRIGRDDDNQIVIDDTLVSRKHCSIRRGPSGWFIQDHGSANGTIVRDERTLRAALSRGDVIGVGGARLTFLGGGDAELPVSPEPISEGALELQAAPAITDHDAVEFLGDGILTTGHAYKMRGGPVTIAVRVVKARWLDDPSTVEWFDRTLAAFRFVDHPGLSVPTRMDGDGAVIMYRERYADRGTLRSRLKEPGKWDLVAALEIVVPIAAGVAALHRQGLVHGGIRPGKVRLFSDSPPRLASPGLTADLVTKTTDDAAAELAFLPPEAFEPGASIGPAGDVWSLGALLHAVLLNAPIGEGKTKEGVIRTVQKGLRKPPAERRPDLPSGLAQLMESCLKLERAERPVDARAVLEVLETELAAARAKPKVESRPIEAKPRELGERAGPPRRSARFKFASYTLTVIIFLTLNALVQLFFGYEIVKIPSCRGECGGSAVQPTSASASWATDVALRRTSRERNTAIRRDGPRRGSLAEDRADPETTR